MAVASTPAATSAVKPRLRGYSHLAAFFASLVGAAYLVSSTHVPLARITATIFAASMINLFGVSALYHLPTWSPPARQRMRRLDHASIFIAIAAAFAPVCLVALGGETGRHLMMLIGAVAVVGIVKSLVWVQAPKWIIAALALSMGWLGAPYIPEFRAAVDPLTFGLILGGGFCHTLGALAYAFKRPNPWPRDFGYHEIFHLLVVVGMALHFSAIYRVVAG